MSAGNRMVFPHFLVACLATWPRLIQKAAALRPSCHWTELKWKLNEGADSRAASCSRLFKCSIAILCSCLFRLNHHTNIQQQTKASDGCLWKQSMQQKRERERRRWLHLSVTCVFVCLLQHHFSKELSGLAPMMLGCGRELKQSWENEINQGGSTSALVPPSPPCHLLLAVSRPTQYFTSMCIHFFFWVKW